MQCLQRLSTVITLVGHQFFHSQRMYLPCHFFRFGKRFMHRGCVAGIRRFQRDGQQCAARQIDGVFRLMCQMSASIFHLRDPRIGVCRTLPLIVGTLLLSLAVHPGQYFPRRIFNSRRLREANQVVVVALFVVPPHNAFHRRIGFQRGGIDRDRLALNQAFAR